MVDTRKTCVEKNATVNSDTIIEDVTPLAPPTAQPGYAEDKSVYGAKGREEGPILQLEWVSIEDPDDAEYQEEGDSYFKHEYCW